LFSRILVLTLRQIIKMKSLLRTKIEKSNHSIKDVAEHCDKTQQTLNNYLNGTQSPTIKTLECIAFLIGCEVFELIEPPKGFVHVYTGSGVWMGIVKDYKNH